MRLTLTLWLSVTTVRLTLTLWLGGTTVRLTLTLWLGAPATISTAYNCATGATFRYFVIRKTTDSDRVSGVNAGTTGVHVLAGAETSTCYTSYKTTNNGAIHLGPKPKERDITDESKELHLYNVNRITS